MPRSSRACRRVGPHPAVMLSCVVSLVLAVTGCGAAASVPPVSPDARVAAVARAAYERTGVPGLGVAVTHHDETVFTSGFGHDAAGRPVTAETPMRAASLTKAVTALATLRLAERGDIDLDAPVADQLPGFRLADPRFSTITPLQLLHQTSGLRDTTVRLQRLNRSLSLADYVDGLSDGRLATQPGVAYAYSNPNYEVLARLLEVVAGRPYADVVRTEVFAPLGMDHSTVDDRQLRPALGHQDWFGIFVPRPESELFARSSGSAGLVTTAADLSSWLRFQSTNEPRLLSPATFAAMQAPSPASPGYAAGWRVSSDRSTLSHEGLMFTYRAQVLLRPESGWAVAVLSNSSSALDPTLPIAEAVLDAGTGAPVALPGSQRALTQVGLLIGTLVSGGLGILGVRRARRWAAHRRGLGSAFVRSLWLLAAPAALGSLPALITLLSHGRVISWWQLTYFLGSTLTMLGVAAAASTVVLGARWWAWFGLTRAPATPDRHLRGPGRGSDRPPGQRAAVPST